jgi:hypothetical protein
VEHTTGKGCIIDCILYQLIGKNNPGTREEQRLIKKGQRAEMSGKYKEGLFNYTNNKKSNAEVLILQHSTFNIWDSILSSAAPF